MRAAVEGVPARRGNGRPLTDRALKSYPRRPAVLPGAVRGRPPGGGGRGRSGFGTAGAGLYGRRYAIGAAEAALRQRRPAAMPMSGIGEAKKPCGDRITLSAVWLRWPP
ncbi:hypothetical protein GCM10009605_51680 [Nocardiopsis composta]